MMQTTLVVLFLSAVAVGQTQTTQCQGSSIEVPAGQGTYTTGTANCTTVTTPARPPMTTREASEAGANLGRGIAAIRARHWVNKFCKKHPGEGWSYRNPAAGIDANGVCFDGNDSRPVVVQNGSRPVSREEAAANSWHTQPYCEQDGFVWRDGGCHAR